ncbi:MAG: hypothetical protein Tsb005_16480 [Gammaproteobacteria bacterium]
MLKSEITTSPQQEKTTVFIISQNEADRKTVFNYLTQTDPTTGKSVISKNDCYLLDKDNEAIMQQATTLIKSNERTGIRFCIVLTQGELIGRKMEGLQYAYETLQLLPLMPDAKISDANTKRLSQSILFVVANCLLEEIRYNEYFREVNIPLRKAQPSLFSFHSDVEPRFVSLDSQYEALSAERLKTGLNSLPPYTPVKSASVAQSSFLKLNSNGGTTNTNNKKQPKVLPSHWKKPETPNQQPSSQTSSHNEEGPSTPKAP